MTILYLIAGVLCTVGTVLIIGSLLPKERVVKRKRSYQISPESLFKIVTDNTNWQYRRDLKDLIMINNENGIETWDEISHDGTVIHFQTKETIPYSLYSFSMKSKLFNGYWTGEFNNNNQGGTIFTSTEHINIKNPFLRALSYLFFNIGKFMEEYQEDLHKKIKTIK
ncbi:hypothetical protein [uncultured Bacteroides sp.]|uniref:hypothetical protein n=1 Tax=uncultured Bacteroides sp. TaxID=162156 RepID=UPI002AAA671A|nr:hypothetical protein [uncultured Bacteroides sp.]